MNEAIKLDSFEISSNGEIKLISDGKNILPKSIFHQNIYTKKNGKEKILTETKLNEAKHGIDTKELFNFDIIFAVDTNTKIINKEKVSVLSMQCCEKKEQRENELSVIFYSFGLACIKNIPDKNEEKLGIRVLVNQIINHPKYNKNFNIGIITDHDLQNIHKYNNRELPIYNDWFLPENFTLIYASADVGKEYLPNKLISFCDKEANKFFMEVKKGGIIINDFKNVHF